MENFAIYATLKAREGREKEVEALLISLQTIAETEQGTKRWFALRGQDRMFGIFDTFDDQEARSTHVNGDIAKTLQDRAADLFEDGSLTLAMVDVLAEV